MSQGAKYDPEEIARRREQHKRDMWAFIKRTHPENAEFIEIMTARYGKPEQVIHEFDGCKLDSAGEIIPRSKYDSIKF